MIKLKPHQASGARWLAQGRRRILADEIGLGKTFTALAAAEYFEDPFLILCPAFLQEVWVDAIRMWDPDAEILILGKEKNKIAALKGVEDGYVVASTGVFRLDRYVSTFRNVPWGCIIFDEAEALRGRNTKTTAAANRMRPEVPFFMLTATPIVNNPSDLYSLLHICEPKAFKSYWGFVYRYFKVHRTPWALKVGEVVRKKAFTEVVRPYMLQRTYEDAGLVKPKLVVEKVPLRLSPTEQLRHGRIKNSLKGTFMPVEGIENPGQIIPALCSLTANSSAKTDALKGLLDRHQDEQVIVWTWYRASAEAAVKAAKSSGRPVFLHSGSFTKNENSTTIAEWKKSPDGILVATIASIYAGQNFQHSRVSIFYEHWYLPHAMKQAIGRQRRMGQARTVIMYRLWCKRTIDEAIMKVAARRQDHNDNAVIAELLKGD